MTSRWTEEKRAVISAAREMAAQGLVTGSSGNLSVRLPAEPDGRPLIAVTPAGRPYASLSEDDIAVVDFDVEQVEGDLAPSSETLLHVAIYQARPDAGAVIHTHSIFASVAAVAGLEIPPIIDEITITIGGAVQVSEYAFPGSEELANNVCAALGERNAALIRNHGAVGIGNDPLQALDVCALVERTAQVFFYTSLLGKASELPPDVVEAEIAIYRMRRQTAVDRVAGSKGSHLG